jgi:Holliday junction resolvase RusA-like endonuclease
VSETWPPEHAQPLVSFEVAGDPKGAGSKDAIPLGRWTAEGGQRRFIPYTRDSGIPIVNVVDSSGKAGTAWREEIRSACAQALDVAHELVDGPIAVRVIFYGESPKKRYGTGRNADTLKPNADRLPHQSDLPDGTKLARALEDALNGLLWVDDRRVCELWWSRKFGRGPGARVDVYGLPARFSDVPGELDAVTAPDQLVIIPGNDGTEDQDPEPLLERAG